MVQPRAGAERGGPVRLGVIGIVAGALAAAGAVTALVVTGHRPEWTTSSPAALAEFEKGQDALQKVYRAEANDHFRKALELDPDFLIDKLFVARSFEAPDSDPKVAAIYDDLRRADLSKLTPRERYLIEYSLAGHAKDVAKAQGIIKAYAAKYPDDPFALEAVASMAAGRQDWDSAQREYTHLMEVAPNRVNAYNSLGYLAMAQGRFAEAEKMFQTYRYIAPDQANPHDSLGELLTLIGRYDEADREFEDALKIRPDFCDSYIHLVSLWQLAGSEDKAAEARARARRSSGCSDYQLKRLDCELAIWPPVVARDWQGVWSAAAASCAGDEAGDNPLRFSAAVITGRRADAEALLEKVKTEMEKFPPTSAARQQYQAEALHMEAVLLLADGKPVEAAARFQAADEKMSYNQLDPGLFKLFNGMYRAKALQQANAGDEAAAQLASLRAVNPKFVAQCARILSMPLGT